MIAQITAAASSNGGSVALVASSISSSVAPGKYLFQPAPAGLGTRDERRSSWWSLAWSGLVMGEYEPMGV